MAEERTGFDPELTRAEFPILSRLVHDKPLTYLDNGASAQKPQIVIDAITKAYSEEYSNVHRGLHYLSNRATSNFEKARAQVQRFLNAPSHENIIFTRNATEAINLVASSYGAEHFSEGDEIILSIMEHHSNIVPWHFHRERSGAVLKYVPCSDDGDFLLEEYEKLFTPKTKFVALTHMSNALGTITPAKEIVRIAHEKGVPVLLDGSQAAVHLDVDVQELDCDFYVFTGHKTYGPSGIGVLYGKKDMLDQMQPYQGGGEMIEDVSLEEVTYNQAPHRFEAGTPSIVQAIGLGAALEYMKTKDMVGVRKHEEDLLEFATREIKNIEGIRIFGEAKEKAAILSFEMEGIHSHDISTVIDRHGVAVRAGTHCAQPLLKRFGVNSTCRASFAMYNTIEDVERFIDALKKAKAMFI